MEFGDWRPHTVRSQETVDATRVAGLAAILDDGLPAPETGEPLPALWHWVALPRWAGSGELGVDGHPRRGGLLPPVDLPRRMIAGGEVTMYRPLRVGETVRRESHVTAVQRKHGRSGPFVLVSAGTRITGEDGDSALTERLDLVYREAPRDPASDRLPTDAVPAPPLHRDDDGWMLRTDATLLMRFSALTANAHRIHYDWPYATEVEGYPGLVVHGPLQAVALAETHRLDGGRPPARVGYRANAPLFCGQGARLRHEATADGIRLSLVADGASRPGFVVHLHG